MKIETKCISCGETFIKKSHNAKYCNKCKYKTQFFEKTCDCGAIFTTTRPKKIHKCLDCRYEYEYKSGFRIFERDGFTCAYCGKSSIIDKVKLVIDHIIPVKRGGTGSLDNLITACESCNLSKNDMQLSDNIIDTLRQKCEELNNLIEDKGLINEHYNNITEYRRLSLVKKIE